MEDNARGVDAKTRHVTAILPVEGRFPTEIQKVTKLRQYLETVLIRNKLLVFLLPEFIPKK